MAGFPHALVMTFLFSNKPYAHLRLREKIIADHDHRLGAKIKGIFTATRTHATNLAKFVTLYKLLLLLQKKMNGGKERDLDSLIAGGLGGWWVFGERTAVSVSSPSVSPRSRSNQVSLDQRADRTLRIVTDTCLVTTPTILDLVQTPLAALLSEPSAPAAYVQRSESITYTARAHALCYRRCRIMGRGHVHVSSSWRAYPSRHGQQHASVLCTSCLVVLDSRCDADWVGYLYHDSEAWSDLRTLLWHNK